MVMVMVIVVVMVMLVVVVMTGHATDNVYGKHNDIVTVMDGVVWGWYSLGINVIPGIGILIGVSPGIGIL